MLVFKQQFVCDSCGKKDLEGLCKYPEGWEYDGADKCPKCKELPPSPYELELAKFFLVNVIADQPGVHRVTWTIPPKHNRPHLTIFASERIDFPPVFMGYRVDCYTRSEVDLEAI
jgi:hypothetical protein